MKFQVLLVNSKGPRHLRHQILDGALAYEKSATMARLKRSREGEPIMQWLTIYQNTTNDTEMLKDLIRKT